MARKRGSPATSGATHHAFTFSTNFPCIAYVNACPHITAAFIGAGDQKPIDAAIIMLHGFSWIVMLPVLALLWARAKVKVFYWVGYQRSNSSSILNVYFSGHTGPISWLGLDKVFGEL